MTYRKRTWTYNPPKSTIPKLKVPEEMKQYLKQKGDEIVEKIFKPQHLEPVPEKQALNHIVDIYIQNGIGIVFTFVSNINILQIPIHHFLKTSL